MNKLSYAFISSLVAFVFIAIPQQASADTIVDIAVGNPDFSSLVSAVASQDLVDTLAGPGPFTVFAPTNEAFANLPSFIGRALEEKPELLKDILLYHVVGEDLVASDVLSKRQIKTVEGSNLTPNLQEGEPFVNSSKIIATDIDADNGTIHVIDKVLVPRSVVMESFRVELKRLQSDFKTLLGELSQYRRL